MTEHMNLETDFNLDDEYKAPPLIPKGNYHAAVMEVKYVPDDNTIDWTFTLQNNGGVCSDGKTQIDGQHLTYRNWLPKQGDENELTKDGKQTKRQAKINMLAQFAKQVGINMNDAKTILKAIADQEWLGMEVTLKVRNREFEGRIFNDTERVLQG